MFDIGGTLWFEARRPPLTEIFAVQAGRVAPLLADWRIRLDVPLEAVMADVWDAAEAAYAVEAERGQHREISVPFLVRGAMAVRGFHLTEEQAGQWHRTAWIGSIPHMGMQLYPDTVDVLDGLRARGITLGVNTNRACTGEMFRADLADAGLADYFAAVVCSGDTGYVKPHPSTFQLALELLGEPPEEVVMVGDSCVADAAGARALGMRTVLKLNGRYDEPACPAAEFAIHDLAELLALPLFGPSRPSAESLTPHDDGNEDRY